MSGDAWFKPKAYGYGATPANWKGWLFLAVMIAVFAAVTFTLKQSHATEWWLGFAIWLAVLIAVSIAKGGGAWRWRWGDRN